MKRKFTVLLLFLVSIFLFSGCSCAGETLLSFSNAFSDEKSIQPGYKQILTYKIDYQEKNEYFEKSSTLTDEFLSVSYGEGKYVQTIEVLSALPTLPDDRVSDISEKLSGKSVFRLTTEFTMPVSYTLNGTTQEKVDYIKSQVYFCPQELSFAPIFSKTESVNTFFVFGSKNANAVSTEINYDILYNLNSYQLNGTSKQTSGEHVSETPINKTVDYTFRTLIDNAQLMFLVRNNVLSSGSQALIKTVAFNYEEPKDLVFTNSSTNDLPVNYDYDGTQVTSQTLSRYEFCLNESNQAGMNQYYLLQEKIEGSDFNSLMVRYIEPIIEFNSLSCLGSLVYELTSVELVNPTV